MSSTGLAVATGFGLPAASDAKRTGKAYGVPIGSTAVFGDSHLAGSANVSTGVQAIRKTPGLSIAYLAAVGGESSTQMLARIDAWNNLTKPAKIAVVNLSLNGQAFPLSSAALVSQRANLISADRKLKAKGIEQVVCIVSPPTTSGTEQTSSIMRQLWMCRLNAEFGYLSGWTFVDANYLITTAHNGYCGASYSLDGAHLNLSGANTVGGEFVTTTSGSRPAMPPYLAWCLANSTASSGAALRLKNMFDRPLGLDSAGADSQSGWFATGTGATLSSAAFGSFPGKGIRLTVAGNSTFASMDITTPSGVLAANWSPGERLRLVAAVKANFSVTAWRKFDVRLTERNDYVLASDVPYYIGNPMNEVHYISQDFTPIATTVSINFKVTTDYDATAPTPTTDCLIDVYGLSLINIDRGLCIS